MANAPTASASPMSSGTVPDYPGGGEVEVERLCSGPVPFPASACGQSLAACGKFRHCPVGVVRAVEESVDIGPVLLEPLGDVVVDLLYVTDVVEPSGATPAWLVTTATGTPARLSRAIASAAPSMNSRQRSTDPTWP